MISGFRYFYIIRKVKQMLKNIIKNDYDDDNIPEIDFPENSDRNCHRNEYNVEPLSESTRPRKDGPGGN